MKLEYLRPGSRTNVLGAGGYSLDHESGNTICTGLYLGGEIVGLLVGTEQNLSAEFLMDNGDEICGRFNAHSTLVQALVQAELALSRSVNAVSADEQRDALAAVREALLVADRS